MKKIIYTLATLVLFIAACEKIDEPYLEPIGIGGESKVTVSVEFLDDMTGPYKLNVMILEDDIIAPQKNDEEDLGPTPDWLDYEHKHILRASLTSSFGIDIVENPLNGTTLSNDFSFGIADEWNADNLSFLVFVMNGETHEVIQAAEAGFNDDYVRVNKKVVLLEEFTGHRCVNCPEAIFLARDYVQTYGEQLLLMTIHAGGLANPIEEPFDTDFRTEVGTDIFNQFNPVAVPTGMVNRKEYEGNVVLFKDSWEPAIQALVGQPQQVAIDISIELAE